MKYLVSKNKALEVLKLKERELNVIVSRYPDDVATYDSSDKLDKIKLNGIVEVLKDDKFRAELGLATVQEIQALLIDMNLFQLDEKNPQKLSDFINKSARDKKVGFVNITIRHNENVKRKLNHRLFRVEECIEYIKTTLLTTKEPKKVQTVVVAPNQEGSLSEQINQLKKVVNFQTERSNKLELLVENLQVELKKTNKTIEELIANSESITEDISSIQRQVGSQKPAISTSHTTVSFEVVPVDENIKKLLISIQNNKSFPMTPNQERTVKNAYRLVFEEGLPNIGKAAAGILRDYGKHLAKN